MDRAKSAMPVLGRLAVIGMEALSAFARTGRMLSVESKTFTSDIGARKLENQISLKREESRGLLTQKGLGFMARAASFMENQNSPEMTRLKYARSDMTRSGCGLIAVYNALTYFGRESVSLPELIAGAEARGAMVAGAKLGTSPVSIRKILKENGLGADVGYTREADDRILASHDAAILMFLNNREKPAEGLHFVFLSKGEDGNWIIHNARGSGSHTAEGPDIGAVMRAIRPDGKASAMWLAGLKQE
ncbi:MAG: hypothetical protein II759_04990 [Lachnospiraceae bacterium]|nr:hypothetical protein [Lachnospiraceae bacterium]